MQSIHSDIQIHTIAERTMAIDWEKKKTALRWGVGCGISYFIYQAFMDERMFQGDNALWEDILLSAICIGLPILAAFLFYWPKQRPAADTEQAEDT